MAAAMSYRAEELGDNATRGRRDEVIGTRPTETTEPWTFVRRAGASAGWKVSAIQEV